MSRLPPWLRRIDARHVVGALLVAWALGIAMAAVRLDAWQSELTRTLLQLRADALFRTSLDADRDRVDPTWYRRKALDLVGAIERIEHDQTWTLLMPGSWHVFDDLEERLSARIAREFAVVVLDTMRRELHARTGELTGLANHAGAAPMQPAAAACRAPPLASTARQSGVAPAELPEFAALAEFITQAEQLDQAVRAWTALQQPGQGHPDDLRRLVRYTLHAELSGPASRSIALFQAGGAGRDGAAALAPQLQAALRCTLSKGVGALHARLFDNNELLALERNLAEAGAGLFDPGARPPPNEATLVRLRTVEALLGQQDHLLARSEHGWMRHDAPRLGADYDRLMQRVGAIGLLGPETVAQVQAGAATGVQRFRQRFQAMFGAGTLVWVPGAERYAPAPERQAMRRALGTLLQEPAMAPGSDPGMRTVATGAVEPRLEDVLALGDVRRRLQREVVPLFPPTARPAMARWVDARLAQVAFDTAVRTVVSAPTALASPFDEADHEARRERLVAVERLLVNFGAASLAGRLRDAQGQDLLRRVAVADETLRTLPLFSAPLGNLSAWQGDPAGLRAVLGVPEEQPLRRLVPDTAARLEQLAQDAERVRAAGGASVAADPALQRWSQLRSELQRYRMRQSDSSLLAFEQYLGGLGIQLRRDNCQERLSMLQPPVAADDIGRRHAQLHQALAARCAQMRGEPVAVGVSAP